MPALRIALGLALALLLGAAPTALARPAERILDFLSDVELRPDSALDVTETIQFQVTGAAIRHGINRDFPTDYRGRWGLRSTTGFALQDVRLDGDRVYYETSRLPNGVRIHIGDPNVLVPPGVHTYKIRYFTWWQVAFRPDADRLDWNVTGNGWEFPIDRAELRLHGPQRLLWHDVHYSGPQGNWATGARVVAQQPGFLDVATTQPLSYHEGLTVAASFPKGLLQEPSALRVAAHRAADNLALFPSLLGLLGVAAYVGWLFLYGAKRPPAAIIPRFAPPNGFSPAMVGYLEDRGYSDRDFSAGIVSLAVARHLKLNHADKTYRLVRQPGGQPVPELEARFEGVLFGGADELSIAAENQSRIAAARSALRTLLEHAMMPALLYREPRNVVPAVLIAVGSAVLTGAALALQYGAFAAALMLMIGLSLAGALLLVQPALSRARGRKVAAVAGVLLLVPGLSIANTSGLSAALVAGFLAATAAIAALSFRRLTVPTQEGWRRRDEIEGLKLFLGVAEADRLRVLNPPDFTPALYEKLLPYAIALGVEMVWSKRFAAALAASQTEYQPDWYDGSHPWNRTDASDFSSDLGGGLAGAVAAAASPPSSGDGSSDGGSGGGGGGGGGSGW